MKENLTSINIILDRSGSMTKLSTDTIGGFNKFISDQKLVEGEATLTLATFSSDYKLVYDNLPLKDIKELTVADYPTGGYTALLDAIGKTINDVGAKLAAMKEEDRPSKVIVLIMTDGEENRSTKFTKSAIQEMIKHQEQKYNWTFVYIGANVDAIKEGETIGIRMANSVNYDATKGGLASAYSVVSKNLATHRETNDVVGASYDFFKQGVENNIIKESK
jgi:uncharacterized protein YegL